MYRYNVLNEKNGKGFAPLTYERYRPFLSGERQSENIILIGAYHLWQPVGLVVAAVDSQLKQAQLLSITTLPDHYNKGIATELLRHFETLIVERGTISVTGTYVGDNAPLERVFAKCGWETPQVIGIALESDLPRIIETPIYQTKPTIPPEYEVFTWVELTAHDRTFLLEKDSSEGWFTNGGTGIRVSPFFDEQFIEPTMSLGIRHNGQVIGWMIVHKIREDTLHFITLFVSREHRGQHLGMMLVMLAVQRGVDYYLEHYPTMRAYWQFAIHNKVMEEMVKHYLAPYALKTLYEKNVCKNFPVSQ